MDFPEIVKLVVDKGKKSFIWDEEWDTYFFYELGSVSIDWTYWHPKYLSEREELKLKINRLDPNSLVADFNDIESLAKATIYINNNHLLDDYIN